MKKFHPSLKLFNDSFYDVPFKWIVDLGGLFSEIEKSVPADTELSISKTLEPIGFTDVASLMSMDCFWFRKQHKTLKKKMKLS